MFDTHCHLNLKAFKKNLDEVIRISRERGVEYFVVPATNLKNAKRAVEISKNYKQAYAAVGVHPHHLYKTRSSLEIEKIMEEVASLLKEPTVVAIGEVGLDKHLYTKTVYGEYKIDSEFMKVQRQFLSRQLELAKEFGKSVIIHNREATKELLDLLSEEWDEGLKGRVVFHCCEADERLLEFARAHGVYLGVDGDVTYDENKQRFVSKIPLKMLVLETDSPFLLPEPLRSQRELLRASKSRVPKDEGARFAKQKYISFNTPANLPLIAEFVAKLQKRELREVEKWTTENAVRLFSI